MSPPRTRRRQRRGLAGDNVRRLAAEDSQATVAKDSQAKAAGVAAKDTLDLHVTMAGVSLPSSSTQRRSCSRSPSSRGSSPILLSMFSTHAAGLQSLSLVCQDQTSQHLASILPISVFVGVTGCVAEVLRAVVYSELRVVWTVCTV